MSHLKPIIRRPKAAEDVEGHAMYIADGSIDAALRFLERAEQTIKGLALFPSSGSPFPTRVPELAGLRTKLVKDFPNHAVFYIERESDRQRDLTIGAAFPLPDVDHPAIEIKISPSHSHHFAHSHSCGVHQPEQQLVSLRWRSL